MFLLLSVSSFWGFLMYASSWHGCACLNLLWFLTRNDKSSHVLFTPILCICQLKKDALCWTIHQEFLGDYIRLRFMFRQVWCLLIEYWQFWTALDYLFIFTTFLPRPKFKMLLIQCLHLGKLCAYLHLFLGIHKDEKARNQVLFWVSIQTLHNLIPPRYACTASYQFSFTKSTTIGLLNIAGLASSP